MLYIAAMVFGLGMLFFFANWWEWTTALYMQNLGPMSMMIEFCASTQKTLRLSARNIWGGGGGV